MQIVTGYEGQAHITSNDDQGRNQGTFGEGSYVLSVGSKFAPTLLSANSLKIADGEGVHQGVHFRVDPGTYDTVTIDNGEQGKNRKDLVVCRYTKDSGTGVESCAWVVIKGTATTGTATRPSHTTGDILGGSLTVDMPFFEVSLSGITVSSVTTLFAVIKGLKELADSKQDALTGAATSIASNNLTANRAAISNSSGKIGVSAVTTTELGYLMGTTSAIQSQFNSLILVANDYSSFYSGAIAMPASKPFMFSVNGTIASIITGGRVTVTLKGIGMLMDSSNKIFDFMGFEGTNKTGCIFRATLAASSSSVTVQAVHAFGDLIVADASTNGAAVAAGNTYDFSIDVSKTGYTALGIVGTLISAGLSCTLVSSYLASSTSATVRIRNNGSSSVTPTSITVKVLYTLA